MDERFRRSDKTDAWCEWEHRWLCRQAAGATPTVEIIDELHLIDARRLEQLRVELELIGRPHAVTIATNATEDGEWVLVQ